MSNKRSASNELNHDNWNQEETSEEPGVFSQAPGEVMEKRIVRTAKRRLHHTEAGKSAFQSFAGFKSMNPPATLASSPFSFLANANPKTSTETPLVKDPASNGIPSAPENGVKDEAPMKDSSPKKSPVKSKPDGNDKASKKPPKYFARLKGLNESVSQWIKKHVDANPYCILTPIFKDYDKHLKSIESLREEETDDLPKTIEKQVSAPTEKTMESSIFGSPKTSSSSTIAKAWMPEKSVFGNASGNAKSIFGNVELKKSEPSLFSNKSSLSSEKNPFFITVPPSASNDKLLGEELGKQVKKLKTDIPLFSVTPANPKHFSFGQSSTASATAGFSFGGGKPFSFGSQVTKLQPDEKTETEQKDEDDEPPKEELKPISEEGSIYEQRCKVFVKKDTQFADKGVGMLFLKPTPNNKMQLIVRAINSLGNLILNTLLTTNTPIKRLKDTTIMIMCLPMPTSEPPPTSVLLRVKTKEDGDLLLEALEKHKK